jgi:hypothetical protein
MTTSDDRAQVIRLLAGGWVAQACSAVSAIGIPDLLTTGPRGSAELAAASATDPTALHRVLRALSVGGVLTELPSGEFELTTAGRLLTSDAPGSLRHLAVMFGADVHPLFSHLEHTIRTGEPPFEHVHGQPYYEFLASEPDRAKQFQLAMGASRQVPTVVDTCDLTGARVIADIGGGNGTLLAKVLAANPGAHGVLLDYPQAVEQAKTVLGDAGVLERCELIAGDFRDQLPTADVYVLSRVLGNWSDAEALPLLRSIHAAAPDQARLLVFDKVLPNGPGPHPGKIEDLLMMAFFRGGFRTEAQFRAVLAEAGFAIGAIRGDAGDPRAECVIEATKS